MNFFINCRIGGFKTPKESPINLKIQSDFNYFLNSKYRKRTGYSISNDSEYYTFSKYLFFYDNISYGEGYIQFSFPFSKNEFLDLGEGEKMIVLLDQLVNQFTKNYLDNDFNASIPIRSIADFDQIIDQNPIKTKTGPFPIKTIPSGNDKIGKIYCNREEIAKLFESPIWEEFYPYQQVFLLSNDLKNESCFDNLELIDFDLTFSSYRFERNNKFEISPKLDAYSWDKSNVSIQLTGDGAHAYTIENPEELQRKSLQQLLENGFISKNNNNTFSIQNKKIILVPIKKPIKFHVTENNQEFVGEISVRSNNGTQKPMNPDDKSIVFEGEEILWEWKIIQPNNLEYNPIFYPKSGDIVKNKVKEPIPKEVSFVFSSKDKIPLVTKKNNVEQNGNLKIFDGSSHEYTVESKGYKSRKYLVKYQNGEFSYNNEIPRKVSTDKDQKIIVTLEKLSFIKNNSRLISLILLLGLVSIYLINPLGIKDKIIAIIKKIDPDPPVVAKKFDYELQVDSTDKNQFKLKIYPKTTKSKIYWYLNNKLIDSVNKEINTMKNGNYFAIISNVDGTKDTSNSYFHEFKKTETIIVEEPIIDDEHIDHPSDKQKTSNQIEKNFFKDFSYANFPNPSDVVSNINNDPLLKNDKNAKYFNSISSKRKDKWINTSFKPNSFSELINNLSIETIPK